MDPIQVVAAVILRRGEYLVQRRGPSGALPNLWEFPGGKVERGETLPQALVRECEEELGTLICVGPKLFTVLLEEGARSLRLTLFWAQLVDPLADPRPLAATALAWCTPGALSRLTFCPADVPVVRALSSHALEFGKELPD